MCLVSREMFTACFSFRLSWKSKDTDAQNKWPKLQACQQRSRDCMLLSAPGMLLLLSSFSSRRKFRVRSCALSFSDSEFKCILQQQQVLLDAVLPGQYVTSWHKGWHGKPSHVGTEVEAWVRLCQGENTPKHINRKSDCVQWFLEQHELLETAQTESSWSRFMVASAPYSQASTWKTRGHQFLRRDHCVLCSYLRRGYSLLWGCLLWPDPLQWVSVQVFRSAGGTRLSLCFLGLTPF